MSTQLPLRSTQGLSNPKDETDIIASSIASGGLIGGGLSLLALQAPTEWQTAALLFVPVVSSSVSITIVSIVRAFKYRFHKRQWYEDRDAVLRFVTSAKTTAEAALRELRDERASQLLRDSISRFEQMRALAISAIPFERPWLTDPVASKVPQPISSLGDTQSGNLAGA